MATSECTKSYLDSKLETQKVFLTDEISYLDGFLSEKDCSYILEELETVFWRPSLTYRWQQDKISKNVLAPVYDTQFRVSETAHQEWFGKELNLILVRVEKSLNAFFGVRPDNLEYWQATKYPIEGKFDYHLDAGYWKDHYAGERILTFLLYLTTPEEGGGTHFRALDVYVEAKKGRLLVWNNLFPDGNANHSMIHSATPLEKGERVTLVTWQRQRKFRRQGQ